MTTAVYSKEHGLRWWVGCKHGINSKDFAALVKSTHKGKQIEKDYLYIIKIVEAHPGLKAHKSKKVVE